MGFLSPGSLFFAALSIPILIMYMLKLRRRDVFVSSVLLWRRLLRDREANAPWQRLRRNLLLLLQLLTLAFLTLALARPFVSASTVASGSLVVLLDASASMQAHDVVPTRFEAAIQAVREMIAGLGPGDVMTIVAVGPRPQVLAQAENDRALLRRVLGEAGPTNGPADWDAAFELAAGLAGSEHAQVVIVSDGALPEALPPLPGQARFVGVGGGGDNLAITALATREGPAGAQAFIRVANYGGLDVEPLIEFLADGVLLDARRLLVPAHGSADLTLADLPYRMQILQARLVFEGEGESSRSRQVTIRRSVPQRDMLSLDNTAWAVHRRVASRRMLLVSDGNLFLERALGALPGVELVRLPSDQLPLSFQEGAQGGYDLYIYDRVVPASLPPGNLWLIAPTPQGGEQREDDGFPLQVGGFFTATTVTHVAADDPLLRYVDLSGTHILQARSVEPPPGARVLVEAEGGPLLFVVERSEGRVAVLTFALHDSDLPLQIAFPILTANLADWLLAPPVEGGGGETAFISKPVHPGDVLPIRPDPEAAEIVVTAPDGVRQVLPVGEEPPTFIATDQLGVYLVEQFDRAGKPLQSTALAINLFDEAESDIAPRDAIHVGQVELTTAAWEERGRRELWPWLAGVALGLLLVEWWVYWRGWYGYGRAWTALVVRCLVVALVILSLVRVHFVHGGDKLAVVFLVDVSDSVPEPERERALAFVEEALAAMEPGDQAALVLFGADALVEWPMTSGMPPAGSGSDGASSILRTHQTNLERAVRLGMALFPPGAARRMVILSDGRPTLGEAEQAVRLARAQGIRVDVVPLSSLLPEGGQGRGEAWLSELVAPNRLYQGEDFALSVTAHATTGMEAALTVLAGEQVVAQEQVRLNPGVNTFAIPLTAGEPGFISFRASLASTTDVYPQNNGLSAFSLIEGPPRVLVVSPSSQEEDEGVSPDFVGEEGRYLSAALRAVGLTVEESTPGALASDPAGLAGYAAVVLVDVPAQALSPRALAALQSYVRDLGGGLVAVGGPHAYGVGGWYGTPLEEMLPVEMTIRDPERFPPMSIVVVIDKSGSMAAQEGGVQKIRLAGEAAARVAELITDLDEITVIAFDDRPVDVIGPLPGSQRDEVIDRVIRLQAGGGGIYVRESLQTALDYLAGSTRPVRHIVLLADGSDSEHQQGVRELVEEEIAGRNITLSTIAIGAGQDLPFLEEIAALGGGRYHFTDRAANLPAIFAEETQLAMRSYIVEELFYPRRTSDSPILTGIEAVPQLAGYVATTPKPAGRVILSTHQGDPLLAAWQYGLGRAVAWTSDATGRWAEQWVSWEDFSRFWAQVVRWTLVERTDVPMDVMVVLEGEEARVMVDAVDGRGAFLNGLDVSMRVVGPGESEPMVVELVQTAPGYYEGAFVPQAEGSYLMRLTASPPGEEGAGRGEEVLTLTSGWVMAYSPEYAVLEGDTAYMVYLAELGGGAVLDKPADALAHNLKGAGVRQDLWPYLLGLATLLWPFDVGVRRLAPGWRDLAGWFVARVLRRRPRPLAEAPSPVARLFQAKSRVEGRRPPVVDAPPEGAMPSSTVRPLVPTPPSEPPAPPLPGTQARATEGATEEETLAGRLLKRKRERRGDSEAN